MPEMTTAQLDFSGGSLILARPGTGDPTLRAWDAADELLLEEAICAAAALGEPRVLVVDDQFGALSLGLAALSPTVVADSRDKVVTLRHCSAHSDPFNETTP